MKKIIISVSVILITSLFIWSQFKTPNIIIHKNVQISDVMDSQDFYSTKVQPIFDARCVACHSCYNSPCQLNLTSYEGVIRGANKISIYDFPKLKDRDPTRLYIDAANEAEWRKKEFYPVISTKSSDSSLLNYMLTEQPGIESKKQALYKSEESRVCMSFVSALQKKTYEIENPAGRMPYGLPQIPSEEIETLKKWQSIGAPGPSLDSLEKKFLEHNDQLKELIKDWEDFFNRKSIKAQISSRYIYEHLFLAHIYFENYPRLFFRLVRAESLNGPIREIGTSFPFDHPGQDFVYRLRPITNTITHKNHIPYEFSTLKKEKWNKNFYEAAWVHEPKEMPAYGRSGANPFKTFAAIPAKSRYQFFLDDSAYHIMTFIKGPVCRGQVALNVINDHFWVLFADPEKDISLNYPKVYEEISNTMSFPAQIRDDFKPLIDFRESYWKSLHFKYKTMSQNKLQYDDSWFWDGDGPDNTNAAITVYRHFDSSTVLRGLRGRVPKTVWVLDYHVFESIYYNLTASYNVFGPLLHQVNSRLFMEISRIASEDLFITSLPSDVRQEVRHSWNLPVPSEKESVAKRIIDLIDEDVEEKMTFNYSYPGEDIKSSIVESSAQAKEALLKKLSESKFSETQLNNSNDNSLEQLKALKGANVSNLPDTILLRLKNDDGSETCFTIIHNEDHYNISMLYFENDRRNTKNDTIDIIPGVATSYANLFLVLTPTELDLFASKLRESKTQSQTNSILKEFGITRDNPDFWQHYQWFSKQSFNELTNESGYLDLNRYINL